MPHFVFSGILSDAFFIPVTLSGRLRITVVLDSTDEDQIADTVEIYQASLAGGVTDPQGSGDFNVFSQLNTTTFGGYGVFSGSYVLDQQGPAGIGLILNSGYTDERASWKLFVIVTTVDSFPIVFDFENPAFEFSVLDEQAGTLMSNGPTRLFHYAAATGIVAHGIVILDEAERTVTLSAGLVEEYDVVTGATRPVLTLTSDPLGSQLHTSSLDRVHNGGFFDLVTPINLAWLDTAITEFAIDERGLVFGFLNVAPDTLGQFLFGGSVLAGDEGVLTSRGSVVGASEWTPVDAEGVQSLMYSYDALFGADVRLRYDESVSTFFLNGSITLIDFLADNPDPQFTVRGGRGLYHSEHAGDFAVNDAGLDGEFYSAAGTRLAFGPGGVLRLDLTHIVYDIDDLTGATRLEFDATVDFGGGYRVGLDLPEIDHTSNADFDLQSIGLFSVGETGNSPLRGFDLALFAADLAGLGATDGPQTISPYLLFEAGVQEGSPALALIELDGDLIGQSIDGAFGLTLGQSGSVLRSELGTGSVDIAGQRLHGVVGGVFHLAYLGDVEVSALSVTQRFGASGWLTYSSDAEVTLPQGLRESLGLAGPLSFELSGRLNPYGGESGNWIELTAEVDTDLYEGDIGFRISFDGQVEYIGGEFFDDDGLGVDPATDDPEVGLFQLAEDAARLYLQAEGDIAPSALVVTGPSQVFTAADFEARGIQVRERPGGLTIVVPNAEAGAWTLNAPGATNFSGLATAGDLDVVLEAITIDGEPGIRVTATGDHMAPEAGYDLQLYIDRDGVGFDGDLVFEVMGQGGPTFEIPYSALGLPPGEWRVHARLSAPDLVPTTAYLGEVVAIVGAPDLAITADLIWPDEDSAPVLVVRVENQGDATASGAILTSTLPGLGPLELGALPSGASLVYTLTDLAAAGLVFDEPAEFELSVQVSGYEADGSDNAVTISHPAAGFASELVLLAEDIPVVGRVNAAGPLALVTQPQHGDLAFDSAGNYSYTPDPNFHGIDWFSYRSSGGSGETRVWLTITPVDDAPIIGSLAQDYTLVVGAMFSLDILGASSDADGDLLEVELSAPVGVLPAWITYDAASGRLVGTPAPGDIGGLTVRIQVTDPTGLSAQRDIHLVVAGEILGTNGADTLTGTEFADSILALNGNDQITGLGGDDLIQAGGGDDQIDGGAGADEMRGGLGKDHYVVDDTGDTIIELAGEGFDKVVSSVNFTLADNLEQLTLTGAARQATGNAAANTLIGTDGDDILDGRGGLDVLRGGLGNDTYVVDVVGELLYELGPGIDTVRTTLNSFILGSAFENLIFIGTGDFIGTGSNTGNTIQGGAGNDTLDGKGGSDNLVGGLGDDLYIVAQTTDAVVEAVGGGFDTINTSVSFTLAANQEVEVLRATGGLAVKLTGNALANTLIGNDSANQLNGGAGIDRMEGGGGDDSYIVDDTADLVVEAAGGGFDIVTASVDYVLGEEIERLVLTGAAVQGIGNALANTITGTAAANLLDGGEGADILIGGLGGDTYVVDDVGDVLVESGVGVDHVRTSLATFVLGVGLENLTYAGSAAFTGSGNGAANHLVGGEGADTLFGLGGADILDGGAGADILDGGAGNDTYLVDDAADLIHDSAGVDTVRATATSYTLGADVEILIHVGTEDFTGTGNALANTIQGGGGDDSLSGAAGGDTLQGGDGSDQLFGGADNDRLYGDAGGDTLNGEAGNDYLYGGSGADHINGGTGSDLIGLMAASDSGPGAGIRDVVHGFDAYDRIDLRLIDANLTLAGDQAFSFAGAGVLTGSAGQLVYEIQGGMTVISGDMDGDGLADFEIELDTAFTLAAIDFLL